MSARSNGLKVARSVGDVLIVGAGIVGASLAWRLARDGYGVTLVDDARLGRATGWNPGGINPLHGPGFHGRMATVYRRAFDLHTEQQGQVRAATGIDFGWRAVDRLFLAADAARESEMYALATHYNALPGFSARWMSPAEIARWDPRVAFAWHGGLMTHGNVRVDAERYRLALVAAAAGSGALVRSARLGRVWSRGDRITAVDMGSGKEPVGVLCMATGAWFGDAIPGWAPGATVPVRALIGDLLLVRGSGDPPRADISHGLDAIYQHDGHYFWVGGTERRSGLLGEGDPATRQRLLRTARRLLPGWSPLRVVAQSSAARPVTPDRLPVVGLAPRYRNAWLLNGCGGKGILLSAWAADAVARAIEAGEDPPELEPFSPLRRVVDHDP